MRALLIVLLIGFTLPAQALETVCGVYISCGIFANRAQVLAGSKDISYVRVQELAPKKVLFLTHGTDPIGDDTPFVVEFADDGHFTIEWVGIEQLGEGSCQNFICQFKLSDVKWADKRPAIEMSATITFANAQIVRTELRRSPGAAPIFLNGVMVDICADPKLRQTFSVTGAVVTEESCRMYFEATARRSWNYLFK